MIEIDPKIIAAATSSLLEIFTDNAKDIGTAIWSWAKDERKRRDIFSGQAKEYSKALQQRYGTMKVLGMT